MKTIRSRLLLSGHFEGISFLLLLFVAMPLKYMADMPLAVRIMGSIHGILFIAFVTYLWEAKKQLNLSWRITLLALLLSITPFGTFFLYRAVPEKQSP